MMGHRWSSPPRGMRYASKHQHRPARQLRCLDCTYKSACDWCLNAIRHAESKQMARANAEGGVSYAEDALATCTCDGCLGYPDPLESYCSCEFGEELCWYCALNVPDPQPLRVSLLELSL